MSRRLSVRLGPAIARWVTELGQEPSATARALMVLGAALLGQPEAAREARRALRSDFAPALEAALLAAADGRLPAGGPLSDAGRTPADGPPAPGTASRQDAASTALLAGGFDQVGYEV